MISKICFVCNKKFFVKKYRENRATCCSAACRIAKQRKNITVSHTCLYCGKKFTDSPCRIRKYCSKSCVNKSEKGIFKPKYSTVRKMMIAKNMMEKCEICGYDKSPQILGVHHIDENRKNNEPHNLKVVCPNCHSILHNKHIVH